MKLHFGWLNNNPLNIRISPNKWVGKVTPSRNKAFETFDTSVNGLRASTIIMSKGYKRSGIDTIEALISKWAPDEDSNDSAGYAKQVSTRTKIGVKQKIDLADFDTLCAIIPAMARTETGQVWQWEPGVLEDGIDAGLGQVKREKKAKNGVVASVASSGTLATTEVIGQSIGSVGMDPGVGTQVGPEIVNDAIGAATSGMRALAPYVEIAQYGMIALVVLGLGFAVYQMLQARK